MRIIVDVSPTIARRAAQAVEEGLYPSINALMREALVRLLPTELRNSPKLASDDRRLLRKLPAPAASVTRPVGEYVHPTDPSTEWLWGMINRVFPLKVAVRTCAEMARHGPVLLQSLHTSFADRGRRVGDLLAASDREQGRRRNETLAVGFPVSPDEQKARVRFAHQFVGRRSTVGSYIGGAFETGLIGVTELGTDWVAPTGLGWQFADLSNHVLDDGTADGANLDEPERQFYLFHVATQVPSEQNAFKAILGVLSREPLDASALASQLRAFQNVRLPKTIQDTTRSGALARLTDVGGICRTAVGRSARYEITDLGRSAFDLLSYATKR